MKKSLLLPVIAATFIVMPALGQETGFYVSGALGQSRHDVDIGTFSSPTVSKFDRKDTHYGLSAGYRFNAAFSVELGYLDFGKATFSTIGAPLGTQDVSATCAATPAACVFASGDTSVKASHLSILLTAPLTDEWLIYGRLGAARSELERQSTSNIRTAVSRLSQKQTDAIFGLGVGYRFTPSLTATLEAQKLQDPKVESLSLGLRFAF